MIKLQTLLLLLLLTSPIRADWWRPSPNSLWQWQLGSLPADLSQVADMYDLDYLDTPEDTINILHHHDIKAICYINVGAWEEWRPDAGQFPADVLGKDYAGWAGEKWLDIRRLDILGPILEARMDVCREKGFDGMEPDNIAGFEEDTGFPLSAEDQLRFNQWLAEQAHLRGLSIGLKNDNAQVAPLLPYFDWALTEDCFDQGWCQDLQPFVNAGKAVFVAEYTDTGASIQDFCPAINRMGFQGLLKHRELDAWRQSCGGNEQETPGDARLELGALSAGDNQTHAYSGHIEVANTQVAQASIFNLRAARITLLPGFRVAPGAWFRAKP